MSNVEIITERKPHAAAMALYRNIGYKNISNYGQYEDISDSVCLKKKL